MQLAWGAGSPRFLDVVRLSGLGSPTKASPSRDLCGLSLHGLTGGETLSSEHESTTSASKPATCLVLMTIHEYLARYVLSLDDHTWVFSKIRA